MEAPPVTLTFSTFSETSKQVLTGGLAYHWNCIQDRFVCVKLDKLC